MTPDDAVARRDVEAIARAMTAAQQRRYLAAAGWATTTWLCPSDPDRLPERWYRQTHSDRYSLGHAMRACLAAELAPGAVLIPALTVKQPWAGAIAELGKRVENRSWDTDHRGPLAIHAGKSWDRAGHQAAEHLAGHRLPPADGGGAWSSGAIVAVAELVDVHRCAGACSPWAVPDQFHWCLANVWALAEPLPCRGALKLWPVRTEIADQLPIAPAQS